MCESVGKADLLSHHFDGKQSREAVDLPLTRHPSPSLTTFTFGSSEDWRLLLDLYPYGGTNPLGMFPLFLRELLMFWPSIIVQCFGGLFGCMGSFEACWRQVNVIPIPKGLPSSSVVSY